MKTSADTWLPKSRVGGQGPYLRSLDHLGSSSEVKEQTQKNKPQKRLMVSGTRALPK